MNPQPPSPVGLAAVREGLAAARARIWLVALASAVGIVFGFATAPSAEIGGYQLVLRLQPLGGNAAVVATGISTPEGPLATDFADSATIERLEELTGETKAELLEKLDIDQPPNGLPQPPVYLIADAGSERRSRALLAKWAQAIREVRAPRVDRALSRAERSLQRRLARATGPDLYGTRAELTKLLGQVQTLHSTLEVDYSIARKARPHEPESTSKARSLAAGLVGGFLVGLAAALLWALLDGRIRTREGVEAALAGEEILADVRSERSVPNSEHARARMRTLGGGTLPCPVAVVPVGELDTEGAAASVAAALGLDRAQVKPAAGAIEDPGVLDSPSVGAWVIAASPGALTRRDVAALRSQLGGIASAAAGVFVI